MYIYIYIHLCVSLSLSLSIYIYIYIYIYHNMYSYHYHYLPSEEPEVAEDEARGAVEVLVPRALPSDVPKRLFGFWQSLREGPPRMYLRGGGGYC